MSILAEFRRTFAGARSSLGRARWAHAISFSLICRRLHQLVAILTLVATLEPASAFILLFGLPLLLLGDIWSSTIIKLAFLCCSFSSFMVRPSEHQLMDNDFWHPQKRLGSTHSTEELIDGFKFKRAVIDL